MSDTNVSAGGSSGVSAGKAWWAVFVLFVAYTFSYIDRWILGLLVQPLKRDLLISDTQIGLLSGLAFAIFYAVAALPIAWLADRKSRRNIIAWGVTVWSLCTAVSGLAQNYWHLFFARMGVGAGEAVLQPAAFSLIADLFAKEKRGLAYGVFGSGTHVGGGIALILGGAIVQWMDHFGTISTFVGDLRSWQIVFFIVGLPGLLVALLMMTIVEPRQKPQHKPDLAPRGAYLAFLRKNMVVLALLFSGFACMGMLTTAYGLWMPSLFIRVFKMTPGQAGFWIGIVTLIVAPIGAVSAGKALEWFTRKGHRDAPLRLALWGMILGGPAKLIAPIMPTFEGVLVFFALGLFFSPWPYVAGASSLPLFTPPNMRAQISALYAFVVTVIALVGGPLMVGVFTDFLFQNDNDVGKSMALLSAIATPVMVMLTLFNFKRFRAAVEVQEKYETAA